MSSAIKRWWDEKRRDGFCDQEMMRWKEMDFFCLYDEVVSAAAYMVLMEKSNS